MQPEYANLTDKPLFGETRPRDRIINVLVGGITTILVAVTIVLSFILPLPPNGINIFFAVCILLIGASNVLLIKWYRQGDLEPKFLSLIYFNAFTTNLLCICAILYIDFIKKQRH